MPLGGGGEIRQCTGTFPSSPLLVLLVRLQLGFPVHHPLVRLYDLFIKFILSSLILLHVSHNFSIPRFSFITWSNNRTSVKWLCHVFAYAKSSIERYPKEVAPPPGSSRTCTKFRWACSAKLKYRPNDRVQPFAFATERVYSSYIGVRWIWTQDEECISSQCASVATYC
jgi:hypothetical protein